MKKYFLNSIILLPFILLSISCTQQEKQSPYIPTDEDWETLRQLKEVSWPEAYRNQDTVLLDQILADEFQMIDASGNWGTKREEIEWIKKNPFAVDSFWFEIKRFEILENGTAIIAGTGHIKADSTKLIYQSSNYLIKRNGQWKAFSSHVSGIEEVE